jgi:YD repeat-containing protein
MKKISKYLLGWITSTLVIITTFPIQAQVEQVTQTEYENVYYQLRKTKTQNSDGTWTVTTYSYPFDFPNDVVLKAMVTANIISTPVQEVITLESASNVSLSILSTTTTTFSITNGLFLPSKVQRQIGAGTVQTLVEFTSYDTNGNLLSYKTKDGQTQNITYFGTADLGKTNLVKTAINSVGQTSSYDYQPLVGLIKTTDVNAKSTTYTYDAYKRLKLISDQIGPLKEYSYHYVGQTIENPITTTPTITATSCATCTPSLYLNLDASKLTTTNLAATLTTNVSANVGAWTMTSSDVSWLTVTGTGSNNGILTIKVIANTGLSPRYATVTVTGGGITQKLTIGQSSATIAAREAVLEAMDKALIEPNEDLQLVVAPNPNNGLFKTKFILPEAQIINLNVVNSQGSSVYSQELMANEGENELGIQLDKQPAGIYFLSLTYKNKQVTVKILKW